jgi:hypothetical protein
VCRKVIKGNLTSPYLQTAVLHRASQLMAKKALGGAVELSGSRPADAVATASTDAAGTTSPAASSSNALPPQDSSFVGSALWIQVSDTDGLEACSVLRVLAKGGFG